MASPNVWWTLPVLSITPKKTFFGLDEASGHCVTLDLRLAKRFDDPDVSKVLHPSESEQSIPIRFLIRDRICRAHLRLIVQDRSRTRTRSPSELPERRLHQFGWKGEEETIISLRALCWDAYQEVLGGEMNHDWRVAFHHLGDDLFLVRFGKEDLLLTLVPRQPRI